MASATSSSATSGVTPFVDGQAVVERGKRTIRKRTIRKRSKIPRLKKWTVVLVEWIDALTEEAPQNSVEYEAVPPRRRSVGHFIKQTSLSLVIAMEDDRDMRLDDDCDTVTQIPLGMITGVTVLVPKK